jgi:hypothetical protein
MGTIVLATEYDLECSDGTFTPIVYVILTWTLFFTIVFTNTIMSSVHNIWINNTPFLFFFGGVSVCFYVYLPIHFFIVDGCQELMRVYIWACMGALYLAPLYFIFQKRQQDRTERINEIDFRYLRFSEEYEEKLK